MRFLSAFLAACTALAILGAATAPRAAAHGWGWGGGWGWGVSVAPIIIAPGPYYAPPAYVPAPAPPPAPPPPPGYYAPYPGFIAQIPPQAPLPSAVPSGTLATALSCNAGQYVCPMEANVPVGGRCYCRGNDGQRVYGTAQ